MLALVDVMSQSTAEEVRLSQERRDAILTFVLEYFTGDQIDSKTLGHFRFIAEVFCLSAKVKEMVGKTSSVQGRQELCVSLALAALNLAVSDEPVEATDRRLERKERRESSKQFEAAVAAAKPAGAGAVAPAAKISGAVKPVSKVPGRTTKYYHANRSRMSPEELAADRAHRAASMRKFRANRKAARTGENAVNGSHQGIRPKYPGS